MAASTNNIRVVQVPRPHLRPHLVPSGMMHDDQRHPTTAETHPLLKQKVIIHSDDNWNGDEYSCSTVYFQIARYPKADIKFGEMRVLIHRCNDEYIEPNAKRLDFLNWRNKLKTQNSQLRSDIHSGKISSFSQLVAMVFYDEYWKTYMKKYKVNEPVIDARWVVCDGNIKDLLVNTPNWYYVISYRY